MYVRLWEFYLRGNEFPNDKASSPAPPANFGLNDAPLRFGGAVPPAKPAGDVDFNKNIVSGTNLKGGYSGYQIWPHGAIIRPAKEKTVQLTFRNIDSIFCYKENDKYDLYLADGKADFQPEEQVELYGPYSNSVNGSEYILMKGATSEQVVTFTLSSTTITDVIKPKL